MKIRSRHVRLAIASIALLAVVILIASFSGYFSSGDTPGVSVDDPEREFTTFASRQSTTVTYVIRNANNRPVHVVGFRGC